MQRHILLTSLLLIGLCACHVDRPAIGYIPTAPVSIPTDDPAFGSLRVDVSAVTDSMLYEKKRVREVQRTAEHALMAAFRSTFPVITLHGARSEDLELRLLRLTCEQVPVTQQVHTQYSANALSSGPAFTSNTERYGIQAVETRFKAALYRGAELLTVIEGTRSTPVLHGAEADLARAIEQVAEELNTRVVDTLLGRIDR